MVASPGHWLSVLVGKTALVARELRGISYMGSRRKRTQSLLGCIDSQEKTERNLGRMPTVSVTETQPETSSLSKQTISVLNCICNFGSTYSGLPWWFSGREFTYQCRKCRFDPWVGKVPWRRKWQLTPVLLSGKSHGKEPGGLQFMGLQKSRI